MDEAKLTGFLAGFAVLGGLITLIGGYLINQYLKTQNQNDDLKTSAIRTEIREAKSAVELHVESVRGDFKALSARIEMNMAQYRQDLKLLNSRVYKLEQRQNTIGE